VHSAWASASLAGSEISLDDFEPPFPDDESGRLAEGALLAASEVGALADAWRGAPLQVLARLHSLAAIRLSAADDLGRPRARAGTGERLATLAETVASTSVAGVIVSAVVHAELMTLKPFGAADDLVARAASRVVLVQRGVDPDAITVPEIGLIDLGRDAYLSALEGYASGRPEQLSHWITFHAAAVQRGASFARSLCV
jgi:hypothetical protein